MTKKVSKELPKCMDFEKEGTKRKEKQVLKTKEILQVELKKKNYHEELIRVINYPEYMLYEQG